MSDESTSTSRSVLDPYTRVAEAQFGLIMVLTFTGSLSVAEAGRADVRTMLIGALGCNLAWGLTDAVMYLVGTVAERQRKVALLRQLAETKDADEAHRLVAGELPERLAAGAGPAALEAMRQQLLAAPIPRGGLVPHDYAAAAGVFVLVVLATFPVVIPFVFLSEAALALRLSNVLAVATLFIGGFVLGRHAKASPWGFGLAMAAIGAALVAAIVALGG